MSNIRESVGLEIDILEAFPYPAALKDKDLVFFACNDQFASIFTLEKDEIVGKKIEELIQPGESLDLLKKADMDVLKNNKAADINLDPNEWFSRCFLVSKTSIGNEDKGLAGILTVFNDITEIKSAEIVNKEIKEKYLHAQKMETIGELSGGVAHDINNMLTAIIGFSNFLLRKSAGNEICQKLIIEIKKAGLRAARITSQLLAFSRKQNDEPVVVNVTDIIEELEKMLRRLLGEEHSLVLNMDQTKRIYFDIGKLEQVLLNIVLNGRDAMRESGKLTITARDISINEHNDNQYYSNIPAGEYVKVSILDTGCGIPDDIKSRLFEPFFTTKAAGKGTGLGLATVAAIIDEYDSYISFSSELGKGSEFCLFFPVTDKEADSTNNAELEMRNYHFMGSALVIEDERAVLDYLSLILREYGFSVFAVSAIEEAAGILKKIDNFKIIISDYKLGNVKGKEIIDTLQTDLPVFFISGYKNLSKQDYEDNLILSKPFTENELMDTVIKLTAS